MLVNAVEIIPGTLMAYHALNYLDVSNYQLSILFMACSLGGIVGSFIGKNIENNNKHLVFVLIGTMFINGLLYLTIWSYNSYFLFLICIFLEHISIILSALAFRTMRQNFSKKDSFGSVLGISGVFVKILVPVSILSGGLIIKYSNSSYIFLVSGIVELVIILPVSLIIINKILKNRSEDDELKYIIN